jgi:hypothetical protein
VVSPLIQIGNPISIEVETRTEERKNGWADHDGFVLPQIRVPEGKPASEPRAAEYFKQMVQRRKK